MYRLCFFFRDFFIFLIFLWFGIFLNYNKVWLCICIYLLIGIILKFLCDVKIIINYLLKIFYFVNNLKNL